MSEQAHEHDEHDDDDGDDAGAPVSVETVLDDAEDEDDAEGAENAAHDAADGEPGDGEHDGDGEHEHEQSAEAAQPAFDQKAIDKIFDSLDREAGRHAKRLGEIMGDDATDLLLCPTCGPVEGMPHLPGFVLNVGFPPEVETRMRDALGLTQTGELLEAKHVRPCEDCAAWGIVKTGSHVPNQDVVMCPTCQQKGYVLVGAPPPPLSIVAANGVEGTASTATPHAIGPEPPEAAALRARGYAVIPPPASS